MKLTQGFADNAAIGLRRSLLEANCKALSQTDEDEDHLRRTKSQRPTSFALVESARAHDVWCSKERSVWLLIGRRIGLRAEEVAEIVLLRERVVLRETVRSLETLACESEQLSILISKMSG